MHQPHVNHCMCCFQPLETIFLLVSGQDANGPLFGRFSIALQMASPAAPRLHRKMYHRLASSTRTASAASSAGKAACFRRLLVWLREPAQAAQPVAARRVSISTAHRLRAKIALPHVLHAQRLRGMLHVEYMGRTDLATKASIDSCAFFAANPSADHLAANKSLLCLATRAR